jgi:hypothetical protein
MVIPAGTEFVIIPFILLLVNTNIAKGAIANKMTELSFDNKARTKKKMEMLTSLMFFN